MSLGLEEEVAEKTDQTLVKRILRAKSRFRIFGNWLSVKFGVNVGNELGKVYAAYRQRTAGLTQYRTYAYRKSFE